MHLDGRTLVTVWSPDTGMESLCLDSHSGMPVAITDARSPTRMLINLVWQKEISGSPLVGSNTPY